MQRLSLAVALLIGAASTINLNTNTGFVSGVYGDEDLSEQL